MSRKAFTLAKLYASLIEEAWEYKAPCLDREAEFCSEPLPSDRRAKDLCSGCPFQVYTRCGHYAEYAARQTRGFYGVWGGKVYGRGLDA